MTDETMAPDNEARKDDLEPINASRQPVVFARDGEVFANSRDVAEFFGKRHDHVLRDIRLLIAKAPDLLLRNFGEFKINDLTGESTSHYEMNRDGFTLLAMGFTGIKAIRWKLRYIDAFNAMESELRNRRSRPVQVMLNDPATLRGLLLENVEKVLVLQAENAALTPKAEALDRIATANGSLCITDAAKALQVRPKDLFTFMQTHDWIYRRVGGKHWLGYQSRVGSGLLEHKVTTILREDGGDRIVEQVMVTPKGLAKLADAVQPPLGTA